MSNIDEIIKSILSEDKSDNEKSEMIEREILKIFDGLGSNLPLNYQLDILRSFYTEVSKRKEDSKYDKLASTCEREGHQFGSWSSHKETVMYDGYHEHQIYPNEYVEKRKYWERTCTRCKFVEKTYEEPQELVEARQSKNRKERIKRLEHRLEILKSEDE